MNRRQDLQQFFISANSSQDKWDFDLDEFTDGYFKRHPDNPDCFTANDIQEVYELGRIHEKKNSSCTGKIIKSTWLRANRLNKNIKQE